MLRVNAGERLGRPMVYLPLDVRQSSPTLRPAQSRQWIPDELPFCKRRVQARPAIMALVGYARVSTDAQDTSLQTDALSRAGCAKIFVDRASGAKATRPELEKALSYMRAGDILIVWKLDRLGRSMRHLVDLIHNLGQLDIGFRSLTEAIDTSSPAGALLFHILGALANFERDLIRERTCAGLNAARARGRVGGRPTVMSQELLVRAIEMQSSGLTIREIARALQIGKSTLYAAMSERLLSEDYKQ